jgi:hypothetical protein
MEHFMLMMEPDSRKAGYLLYRIHSVLVVLLVLSTIFIRRLRPYILIFYIPFFYLHVHNNGCPITKAERKLHKEDLTVLDPVLMLMGVPPTNKNRNLFQIFVSTVFVLLLVFMLFP